MKTLLWTKGTCSDHSTAKSMSMYAGRRSQRYGAAAGAPARAGSGQAALAEGTVRASSSLSRPFCWGVERGCPEHSCVSVFCFLTRYVSARLSLRLSSQRFKGVALNSNVFQLFAISVSPSLSWPLLLGVKEVVIRIDVFGLLLSHSFSLCLCLSPSHAFSDSLAGGGLKGVVLNTTVFIHFLISHSFCLCLSVRRCASACVCV